MSSVLLQIPIKPLSVNGKFTIARGQNRIAKRWQVYAFEKTVRSYLHKRKEDLEAIRDALDKRLGMRLEITIKIPKKDFYTKKGDIGQKCLDVSNALKILEDTIYDFMGVNDAFNVFVSCAKMPYDSEDYMTEAKITLEASHQALES
jgi:hypothetical protein